MTKVREGRILVFRLRSGVPAEAKDPSRTLPLPESGR